MPSKSSVNMIDIKDMKKLRVAIGLSGGVDSSVAAFLLKEAGCEVSGIHMICWDDKQSLRSGELKQSLRSGELKMAGCTADRDRKDAARAASHLKINFEALNFVNEYKNKVINYFYSEYKAGRTPNPDIMCNKEIKFGIFMNWAIENGFDYIATGHYARTKKTNKIDLWVISIFSNRFLVAIGLNIPIVH